MIRAKELEILMLDGCTKSDAEKHLNRGATIFEDFEEHFDDYMQGWNISEEDQEEYKNMIKTKQPVLDWGVVEVDGKTYYIEYVL